MSDPADSGPIPVSVIVLSRRRPAALARCLRALSQMDHPEFEIVVVADAEGLAAIREFPVKTVAHEAANISAARNAGIGAAAGRIVAFIDDDAVPEPTWLTRLTKPFEDPGVAAAGGFVRGRNGISYQSTAASVNRLGEPRPLTLPATGEGAADPDSQAHVLAPPPNAAIKTEGTNCAFRRDVLADLGGFDPAFRFYLDETDLNMRLASAGCQTAIVPGAQVHHGFHASAYRTSGRVPISLFEIGASTAVFWHKHAGVLNRVDAEAALRHGQRIRLLRHMVSGGIEPRDVGRLLETLDAGLAAGKGRPTPPLVPLGDASEAFRRYPSEVRTGRLIAGRVWNRVELRRRAKTAAAAGEVATLLLFSPTALFHRMRYSDDGYWEQSGGLFGRAVRSEPMFRTTGFSARVRAEAARISEHRPITDGPHTGR